jgi:hypothetical protein
MSPSEDAPTDAEHFPMYGGHGVLSFDPDDHQYFFQFEDQDYGNVISSTQVLDNLAKPGLRWWAVNETISFIEEKWNPGASYDEVAIESVLEDAKYARFKSSGEAKKVGTLVHQWIEQYVRAHVAGKAVTVIDPDQGEVDTDMVRDISLPYNDKAQDAIQQFLSWVEDHDIEWIAAEQRAVSKKLSYAGTYDAEAIIDGDRTLIDWKTSKGIYDEYPLQTAAYVYAREEESAYIEAKGLGDRVRYDQMMILRVPKSGEEFEVWSESDRQRMVRLAQVFQSLLDVQIWQDGS